MTVFGRLATYRRLLRPIRTLIQHMVEAPGRTTDNLVSWSGEMRLLKEASIVRDNGYLVLTLKLDPLSLVASRLRETK